ncbi:MAG: asparagine synthase (glutamine-hydrolyzing) [Flavobacteriaceae bacterium]|uniref:asparagine synthase (glutamine-hydrolyzing) n=1 Tax=Phaeodactylibacter xiamenensis TaxID=1524460 RepID=A0A098S5W7_9BACT|nr:asparagine synthase (glutamine-hydrolyzing) [Phaeodactylibacter xiamenensis]KGE86622.1 hypothetical protein IX84_20245 [Phaeodactylibacter xiamenensis]MCR9265871.1 asparagine synthase (glutamine-hydrolyzing) [Flavobacteriaceae bacterium]
MCGIAGIYRINTSVALNEIDNLTNYLTHRGPDGRGIWFNERQHLALGHRRLSILDLSEAGKQPMQCENGKFVITLNGEIYNFIEVRDELKTLGYKFNSETDTEVILRAYEAWGSQMLNKFNGMWALAIYDVDNNKLILSRDRFGIKPLYYFWDGEELVFASEVQALHKHLGERVSINKKTIEAILNFDHSYHGTAQTYLNEVKSLPAGTNFLLVNNKVSIERWYQLKKQKVPKTLKAQAQELKILLADACKVRLRSDVPVGTCLSGGIDSGTISSLISTFKADENQRFSNFTHRSFCAGFPGISFDETQDARRLAKQLDINLDVEIVGPPSEERLERALAQTDGPMPAFAFFPIWQLYGYIKSQNITVTLDGQGADEMLGGYYLGYNAMKGALQKGALLWLLDVKNTYSKLHPKASSWVRGHYNHLLKQAWSDIKQILKWPIKKVITYMGLRHFQANNLLVFNNLEPNSFEEALYQQFFSSPLPFLLHQYDRASMANGIECRMPFMDYRVVEYIFSLPSESKVGGGYTKLVLREAVKGILPDETRLNTLKTGFNAPTTEWFQTDLKDWFLKQINSSEFLNNPYFDGKALNKEFTKKLDSADADTYKWKFWAYIHVSHWLKTISN